MDKENEGGGGGGADDIKSLKDQNAELIKRLEALEKLKPDDKKDEKKDDLSDLARKQRENEENQKKHEKNLEQAINFNVQSKDFIKLNASLLPKTVEGIFQQAEKENYGSAIEKANAIKVGIVQEYFAIQANMDLLTTAQKIEVDDFLKLTKNGKQDKIASVYSMIFEPALETQRKIEKAKQVHVDGKDQTDSEKALADKLMKLSQKHYLGVK